MKKNSLTLAIVAGIAGIAGFAGLANAVDLNPDRFGQLMIYPDYSVDVSRETVLDVVNTRDIGHGVKVRFLEGDSPTSADAFAYMLYPSRPDVLWFGVDFAADYGQTVLGTIGSGHLESPPTTHLRI